jgi:hypothetical protein
MCGRVILPGRDDWALDKNGDALCHDCHIQAVLLLKAQGVDWEGQTFGYELGPTEEFGGLADADTGHPASPSKKKVGRNEPCPCGSGKKFKRCCGQ